MSLVAKGVSAQPYLSRKAPKAFCPSDSLETRSVTAPNAAPLTKLALVKAIKPAGILIGAVAATHFAAKSAAADIEPK